MDSDNAVSSIFGNLSEKERDAITYYREHGLSIHEINRNRAVTKDHIRALMTSEGVHDATDKMVSKRFDSAVLLRKIIWNCSKAYVDNCIKEICQEIGCLDKGAAIMNRKGLQNFILQCSINENNQKSLYTVLCDRWCNPNLGINWHVKFEISFLRAMGLEEYKRSDKTDYRLSGMISKLAKVNRTNYLRVRHCVSALQ